MPLWVGVGPDPRQGIQMRLPIHKTGMMIRNQHGPLRARQPPHALTHVAGLVHETFLVRLAVGVCAGVRGIGQHVVDGGVGRYHPADLAERSPPHGEAETLRAEPQPHATHRAELTEALEYGADGASDGLVRIEADLAVLLAPDESHR